MILNAKEDVVCAKEADCQSKEDKGIMFFFKKKTRAQEVDENHTFFFIKFYAQISFIFGRTFSRMQP